MLYNYSINFKRVGTIIQNQHSMVFSPYMAIYELVVPNEHTEQAKFQDSEYFKEKSKERYKIEAKNSELKHRHGYDVAKSSGLIGMELQGAMAIFTVNLKRILKLMD